MGREEDIRVEEEGQPSQKALNESGLEKETRRAWEDWTTTQFSKRGL